MIDAKTGARLQLAAEAAKRVLVGIASCDLVSDFGSVPMYAIRDYREDVAADIYKTIWSADELTEEEMEFLVSKVDWTLDGIPIGPKDRSQCQSCGQPMPKHSP